MPVSWLPSAKMLTALDEQNEKMKSEGNSQTSSAPGIGASADPRKESRSEYCERLPEILEKAAAADTLYHRLVLVVGAPGTGKTAILTAFAESVGVPILNVNLSLSAALMDLPIRRRPLDVPRLLSDAIAAASSEPVVLDNLEMLFDTSLKVDLLACLRHASRNRTIVASFPGTVQDGHFVYAEPHHPEFRRFPAQDILVVNTSDAPKSKFP